VSVVPDSGCDWCQIDALAQACDQARNNYERRRGSGISGERNNVFGFRAFHYQWQVFALLKENWLLFTQAQSSPDQIHFDSTVLGRLIRRSGQDRFSAPDRKANTDPEVPQIRTWGEARLPIQFHVSKL